MNSDKDRDGTYIAKCSYNAYSAYFIHNDYNEKMILAHLFTLLYISDFISYTCSVKFCSQSCFYMQKLLRYWKKWHYYWLYSRVEL